MFLSNMKSLHSNILEKAQIQTQKEKTSIIKCVKNINSACSINSNSNRALDSRKDMKAIFNVSRHNAVQAFS